MRNADEEKSASDVDVTELIIKTFLDALSTNDVPASVVERLRRALGSGEGITEQVLKDALLSADDLT